MTDLSRLEPNWNIPRFRLVTRRRLVEFAWHEHFHRHPDPFVWDSIYARLSDIDGAQAAYGDPAGYDRIRLSSNNSLVASHCRYERLGFQPVLP